uniref:ATP synthase complex subunit 8 n=1 Tax=Parastichopus nigripunctatus TaxID=683134 RepID=C9K7R0_9ECHN|nr:ATP synthase F0 subunit 8 [Parastichopus nigripunctatus]BAI45144.1 ATP synthase subunit 8 [Parastichopus nigripunctatus]
MPQLDLSWFIINFFLAWSLVIIMIVVLVKQNWLSDKEGDSQHNNKIEQQQNEWNW